MPETAAVLRRAGLSSGSSTWLSADEARTYGALEHGALLEEIAAAGFCRRSGDGTDRRASGTPVAEIVLSKGAAS